MDLINIWDKKILVEHMVLRAPNTYDRFAPSGVVDAPIIMSHNEISR